MKDTIYNGVSYNELIEICKTEPYLLMIEIPTFEGYKIGLYDNRTGLKVIVTTRD